MAELTSTCCVTVLFDVEFFMADFKGGAAIACDGCTFRAGFDFDFEIDASLLGGPLPFGVCAVPTDACCELDTVCRLFALANPSGGGSIELIRWKPSDADCDLSMACAFRRQRVMPHSVMAPEGANSVSLRLLSGVISRTESSSPTDSL